MAAHAQLYRSDDTIERETLEVLKENKLRIREVWKKLWKALWLTANAIDLVITAIFSSHLVRIVEVGKPADEFHPKEELLKKTFVL